MKPIVDCFNEISNNFQKRFYTALSEFVTCLEAEGGKKCISTEYETKAAGILEQNQTVARGGGRRRRRQLPEGCTIKQVQQLWIQCMKP